ncbi:MAG: hypothetical protein MRK00_06255 [Nitrosomonas sp.]|nr:hypothetical protein [Nitrosomonas sp.]
MESGKLEKIKSSDSKNEVVARVPKEQLKSLFYLFAGKPDSRIQVFESAVHLKPNDIRASLKIDITRQGNSGREAIFHS